MSKISDIQKIYRTFVDENFKNIKHMNNYKNNPHLKKFLKASTNNNLSEGR